LKFSWVHIFLGHPVQQMQGQKPIAFNNSLVSNVRIHSTTWNKKSWSSGRVLRHSIYETHSFYQLTLFKIGDKLQLGIEISIKFFTNLDLFAICDYCVSSHHQFCDVVQANSFTKSRRKCRNWSIQRSKLWDLFFFVVNREYQEGVDEIYTSILIFIQPETPWRWQTEQGCFIFVATAWKFQRAKLLRLKQRFCRFAKLEVLFCESWHLLLRCTLPRIYFFLKVTYK